MLVRKSAALERDLIVTVPPDSSPPGPPGPRPRAVILSGRGRFADAWHPFEVTSSGLAQILRAEDFEAEIAGVDERMADLDDAQLVAFNIGAPSAPDPDRDSAARQGLLRYLERGGPLLVMHVSSTSLPAVGEWESIIGGIWVRGATMHPEYGLSQIHVRRGHPITATAGDFTLFDERYSYLRVADDVTVLASHEHDGVEHPIMWARTLRPGQAAPSSASRLTAAGPATRVVYDALGHDGASYESPEHREIIARSARWLVGELGG
jgi:type 1 glutamine amidotransferase